MASSGQQKLSWQEENDGETERASNTRRITNGSEAFETKIVHPKQQDSASFSLVGNGMGKPPPSAGEVTIEPAQGIIASLSTVTQNKSFFNGATVTKHESVNSDTKEPAHHQGQENITNGGTVAKHNSVNGNVKEPVHYQGQKNITNGAGSLNGNVKELVHYQGQKANINNGATVAKHVNGSLKGPANYQDHKESMDLLMVM